MTWHSDLNEKVEYPFKFFDNAKLIFCKICEKSFGAIVKTQIEQHKKSGKYKGKSVWSQQLWKLWQEERRYESVFPTCLNNQPWDFWLATGLVNFESHMCTYTVCNIKA